MEHSIILYTLPTKKPLELHQLTDISESAAFACIDLYRDQEEWYR